MILNSSFRNSGARVSLCVMTSGVEGEGGRTVVMFHDLVAVQKAKPFVKLLYDGDFSHYADFIFASPPPPSTTISRTPATRSFSLTD